VDFINGGGKKLLKFTLNFGGGSSINGGDPKMYISINKFLDVHLRK
jgi:hypothetical protein